MVRWKKLKRWSVHTAFAQTQIGRYGKWRLLCIDTLVLLVSTSIHFWDLKSKTIWQAVGVWVFYRGRIKLTVVDAEDLGIIHLFGGKCDWRRPRWCWNLDYTRFYHIVDHYTYSEALSLMGHQPLNLMVRVIRVQWPRLKRSSSKTSVYPFMTSLMQGWQQLSDRGFMGDDVCIWRNAEVLTKRCHFACSIINLPIPSADSITFVTSTWSASASMSLTSVSPITGRGVPPSLHTRPDGQSNDSHPSLRHLDIYFSAMSDLAAPVSSRTWTCSPAISSYIQNGDSTAISGPLKPYVVWLDTQKHSRNGLPLCSMRRLAGRLFTTSRQFFVGAVVGVPGTPIVQVQTLDVPAEHPWCVSWL